MGKGQNSAGDLIESWVVGCSQKSRTAGSLQIENRDHGCRDLGLEMPNNITAAGAVDREFDIHWALGLAWALGPGPWARPLGPAWNLGPKGLGPWAQALGWALAPQIQDFPALGPPKNIDFP